MTSAADRDALVCMDCGSAFERKAKSGMRRCATCTRVYFSEWRRRRKAEGRPVKITKMSPEWFDAYNKKYRERDGIRAKLNERARIRRAKLKALRPCVERPTPQVTKQGRCFIRVCDISITNEAQGDSTARVSAAAQVAKLHASGHYAFFAKVGKGTKSYRIFATSEALRNVARVGKNRSINLNAAVRGRCAAPACEEAAKRWAGRMAVCDKHMQRWQAYGSFDLPDRRQSSSGLCTAPSCDRPLHSKNLAYCRTHYFRLRRKSKEGLAPIPSERDCVICGSRFSLRNLIEITCSDECARFRLRQHVQIRRIRKETPGRPYEVFSPREIFVRDNWTCQICKNPINRWEDRNSRDAATIDHIVPISRGGLHLRRNVQTAHGRCNSRKHKKLMSELVCEAVND